MPGSGKKGRAAKARHAGSILPDEAYEEGAPGHGIAVRQRILLVEQVAELALDAEPAVVHPVVQLLGDGQVGGADRVRAVRLCSRRVYRCPGRRFDRQV